MYCSSQNALASWRFFLNLQKGAISAKSENSMIGVVIHNSVPILR